MHNSMENFTISYEKKVYTMMALKINVGENRRDNQKQKTQGHCSLHWTQDTERKQTNQKTQHRKLKDEQHRLPLKT